VRVLNPGTPRALATIARTTFGISLSVLAAQARGVLSREGVDARIDVWSREMLGALGLRVRVRGAENLRGWRAALVMSNHQSHFDVPVLFQVIPPSLRMVAKVELARVPVWGAAMRAGGIVFIDRSDRARAIASLAQARAQLAEGVSVWIAPEGTRSLDGALGAFKKGGFVLAEEVGADIVPVTISGTRLALPVHSRSPRQGVEVTVTVHPRVRPGDHPGRDARVAAVRASIASALPPAERVENAR
jgi:1-acyl-sn-glycerol-3-phosphate acyltransferase